MSAPSVSSPPIDLSSINEPLLSPNHLAPRRTYDVIIIGAGIAGLTLALRLPADWRVALLTKGILGESNTRYAQGGLSAAIGPDDSPQLHEIDTLNAGAGLCDPEAVRFLVEGAPAAVRWLLDVGTQFDRADQTGEILLGNEAAHSRRRVLHAGGDATGAEIERALVETVRARSSIDIWEQAFAIDLVVEDDRCVGLLAQLSPKSPITRLDAPAVVIAAGGAGQLWATTSNPPGATADGLAMALRAGARVADVEFVQFHPTVLALPDSTPFLVSEAVRGEGAYLRGRNGERFMLDLHPLAELAPRDVVARGIQRQMAIDNRDHVDLDLRHLDAAAMRSRFPTISRELASRDLDLATDLIPVAPAAHYFMGGIVAGPDGQTSLPGLLALGEASCTGVHGANRLASNSLLEGLVFGIETADRLSASKTTILRTTAEPTGEPTSIGAGDSLSTAELSALAAIRSEIQRAMSRDVAVVRDAEGLKRAAEVVQRGLNDLTEYPSDNRTVWELRNLGLAASAVISAATLREESRGAHFRSDFPDTEPSLAGCHLSFNGADWRYGSLLPQKSTRKPS